MDHLLALVVTVPLIAAAAITAAGPLFGTRRQVLDAVAIAVAASVTVMLAVIMVRTAGGDEVYWFGGFRPVRGVAIGIDFEAGSLSTGLACLAALLVTTAMTFSWRYFERVATHYHTLMLTFLAGMAGFCLTGDVFDMFVWFELMGVSAYALTAYRPEERGPIQGALAFAITNSVGAYLSLSGIGLIYGRTGALNMAQIGVYIDHHRPDGLVTVAFLLIISGFLIKGAIVPFHFWLADAHAVAPTPVCVLFSGVMVELGLYAIARVYWSVFGQALGHRAAISHVFLALGVLTAVVGALFCFRERHVKRLLAFSTISHAGMFLAGITLLTPSAWPAPPSTWPAMAWLRRPCSCAPGSCCTGSARSTRPGCTAAAATCAPPAWSLPWPRSGWPISRRSPLFSARASSTTAPGRTDCRGSWACSSPALSWSAAPCSGWQGACSKASATRLRRTPGWPRWPPRRPAKPNRTSSIPRSP